MIYVYKKIFNLIGIFGIIYLINLVSLYVKKK